MLNRWLKKWFNYYDDYCYIKEKYARESVSNPYFIDLSLEEKNFLKRSIITEYYNVPDYSLSYVQPELFYAYLECPTLLGNTGALVKDEKLLVESLYYHKKCFRSDAYRKAKIFRHSFKKGLYTSIFYQFSMNHNIFHWYLECLPRLYLLRFTGINEINLICNKDMPDYQLESIANFIEKDIRIKYLFIDKNEKWTCEKYIFLSFLNNVRSGYLPKDVINYFSNFVENILSQSTCTYREERIYIDRSNTAYRRVVNQEEVDGILKKYRIKKVRLEEMSSSQQIELFKNVKLVIGTHGAGLTNILFSNAITVIELLLDKKIKSPYFLLSKAKGHLYKFLICQTTNSTNKNLLDNDIIVDVRELDTLIGSVIS